MLDRIRKTSRYVREALSNEGVKDRFVGNVIAFSRWISKGTTYKPKASSKTQAIKSAPKRAVRRLKQAVAKEAILRWHHDAIESSNKHPKTIRAIEAKTKRFIQDYEAPAKYKKGFIEKEAPELADTIKQDLAKVDWQDLHDQFAQEVEGNLEQSEIRASHQHARNLQRSHKTAVKVVAKAVDYKAVSAAHMAMNALCPISVSLGINLLDNLADDQSVIASVTNAALDGAFMQAHDHLTNMAQPYVGQSLKRAGIGNVTRQLGKLQGVAEQQGANVIAGQIAGAAVDLASSATKSQTKSMHKKYDASKKIRVHKVAEKIKGSLEQTKTRRLISKNSGVSMGHTPTAK